jgi:hypothetical protein
MITKEEQLEGAETAIVADAQIWQAHVEQVASTSLFTRSAALRDLLLYLFEHRDEDLSEYAIAVAALHRRDSFDPRFDATVRVQIARLRRKLKEYYDTEGQEGSLRLSIPLGGHRVQCEVIDRGVQPAEVSVEDLPKTRWSTRRIGLAVSTGILVVAIFAVGWILGRRSSAGSESAQPLPMFWSQILSNNRGLKVVIPNPTFFTWNTPRNVAVMARDTSINEFSDMSQSPEMDTLTKKLGKPALAQSYLVETDVQSLLRLKQYLTERGLAVEASSTSATSEDNLERANQILLGTYGTLAPFRGVMDDLDFRFGPKERTVFDRNAALGQPNHFDMVEESPTRMIVPGIIAYRPGRVPGTHVLVLASARTAALIAFLTSQTGLAELEKMRKQAVAGEYFDAAVMSEIDGGNYLKTHVAAIHPLKLQPHP